MTKLSFCVPIESETEDPTNLVLLLLKSDDLDLEVVISAREGVQLSAEIITLASGNERLRLITAAPKSATEQDLWTLALETATGEWLALVRPDDVIERELTLVAAYLDENSPQIDALAWNVLQIDPTANKSERQSIAIPIDYAISAFDKNVMMQRFFAWADSRETPIMPFGLFHGMIRRSLAETVLATMQAANRKTCLPQYEWAARVILLASELAFAARPMSVAAVKTYEPPSLIASTPGFPFHAGVGISAGIAEIQHALLQEMGSEWAGSEEAFVRACIIDCMLETQGEKFAVKAEAYFTALSQWRNGRFVPMFQPEFVGEIPKDIRRGLHGNALMIDRFIGGAVTPQDFYRIVRSFLAPIRLICGGATA